MKRTVLLSLCLAFGACVSPVPVETDLATAQIASDFGTYQLQRVGLLPFLGLELSADQEQVLQSAFFTEFSASTPFEVVPLSHRDLEEVPGSEPYRRGGYDPRTIIDISRRFRLEGVFVATVTNYQFFKPQRLSVQVDLVATETGVAIWSSSIHLDAGDERVRRSLEGWSSRGGRDGEVTLLSPRLFAQFAANQMARML